jgi:ribosomal protein S18 acetylase RimI-like enzyme
MTSSPVVRPATADDAETWRELRHRALADTPSAYGSTLAVERGHTAATYAARLAEGNAVLAFDGPEPVGMGAGYVDRPGWFHLVAIWVAPDWRGHGLNGRLLAALCDRADGLGLRVHLDVNAANAVALASYERFGFVRTREQRPLRDGSEERCERMVLRPG